jgi:hypothetical protein
LRRPLDLVTATAMEHVGQVTDAMPAAHVEIDNNGNGTPQGRAWNWCARYSPVSD